MNDFFKYAEEVEGYDVRVVNEREAREDARYAREAAEFETTTTFNNSTLY